MSDEWEDAPSNAGWEDAPSDNEGFLKKALGVGEAGLSTATGLLSAIPGGIAGVGSLVTGGGLEGANKTLHDVSDALTYEPRTKTGKKASKVVNDTLSEYQEDYSDKFAADAAYLTNQKKNPTASDYAAENTEKLVGSLIAGLYVPGLKAPAKGKPDAALLSDIEKKQAEVEAKPKVTGGWEDAPTQMDLLTPDNQGKAANPYEAQHGYWVTDENGMPIRADLSMEAQNLQDPLQRNLFGDELPPRETPVGQSANLPMDRDIMGFEKLSGEDVSPDSIGITQAMDNTRRNAEMAESLPEAADHLQHMQMQMDALSHDLKADGYLERAKMDAEITTPRSEYTDPTIRRISPGGRQTGAIDIGAIRDAIKAGLDKIDPHKYLEAWKGAFDPKTYEKLVDVMREPYSGLRVEFMSPRDFHTVANPRGKLHLEDAPRLREKIRGALDSEKGLLEAPELWLQTQKGISKVAEHEGRHRMDVFREMGIDKVPVLIHDANLDGSVGKAIQPQWTNSSAVRVPLKQRGAVGNLNPGKKARTVLDDIKARYEKTRENSNPMIPENPDPKQVVAEALQEGKDSKQWKYTESGATLASLKRASAAVQGAARIVQNFGKRAEYNIRKMVFPVEKAFRKLSKDEIKSLSEVMKKEMLVGKRFDPLALEAMPVRMQVAYAHMRAMFEDTLRIQNEARAAKGQSPITEMEAYLSSRWEGDFRRPVFQAVLDKNGNPKINPDGTIARKLVYYLAANTKRGLEQQWKALQKEHPDFTYDPKEDHTVRMFKRETDLQSAYSTILDILGDDPAQREAVNLITKALQEQTVNEAASFLGQEKHFKEKAGIRGFVGDRPGKEAKLSEATAMFQQQIQYAKNAYKWSEMQKAGQLIKEIVSDKELVKQQPNNVQYIKEYYKQNVGYGESVAIAHLEDAIRNLGVSPAVLDSAVGTMKSYFILQKLAVNTGYSIANILQTSNVLPHLVALSNQGYKGSYLKAIPMGIAGGIAMATGHYANLLRGAGKDSLFGTKEGNFLDKAFRYAEDNGVTARALYDESPIETSFSKVGKAANALGKTMSASEAFVRSMGFMTFVQFLKDSGKYTKDIDIFQKAEELTNAALVDYRRGERPMIFEKLGTAGNFLNTLQTYPMNWYNQWNYFGRQAMKGNVGPFVSALALQYAMAGAMGVPGFDDMTKLWDFIKNNLVPTDTYAKMRDNDFFVDPKMWMVKNFGQASVYGWLSDKSGIGLTSRVNAPGANQMIVAPGGPIVDVAKQGMNWADAAMHPTNKTKWAQAAMASTPPGLQGLLEQAPFMQGETWDVNDKGERVYQRPGALESHTGVVKRSPEEETLRNYGLRSQRETVERELGYRVANQERADAEKIRSIPQAIYDAAKRGDKESVQDLYSAYIKLNGKEPSADMFDALIKRNYMTTFERTTSAAKSITQLRDAARMKAILDEVRDEYKSGGNR